MLLWAKVTTSRCCITLINIDGNSDHELIIQSLVIEVEFIAWSNMITCCVILAIFWPKIDRHLITIVPSSFKCAECEVKCHLVWNTLITFDHPLNPFLSYLIKIRRGGCQVWSRLEEEVVKKILEFCDRCCWRAKILWLGHFWTPAWVVWKRTQETQWLLSYFIGTPTVRNNYYHECNYNYGKTPTK